MSGRRGSRIIGVVAALAIGAVMLVPGTATAAEDSVSPNTTTCGASCASNTTANTAGSVSGGDSAADHRQPVTGDAIGGGADSSAVNGDDAGTGVDVSKEYRTTITFTVDDHITTVTKTYTNSLDVTVPDDTQLGVPDGKVIVGWQSSLGMTYSADLSGATVTGQQTVTFTAILAQQMPDLPQTNAKQVQVRFVLPGTLNAVVTTTVDRGSSYADAYAANRDEIASRLPKNLRITQWRANGKTYRADLSDAGTADHDTTFFAVPDVQATQTLVMFSVGKLFVTEQVKTGSALSDAYAAKAGAIKLLVPWGYTITGWTDESTGATYAADLSDAGTAAGWTMRLNAVLKQTDTTPDADLHATVTFNWTDGKGAGHTKSVRVLKGLWLLDSQIPSPQAPNGYVLKGWYTAAGVRFNRFLPVRESATYTAQWVKIGVSPSARPTTGTTTGIGTSGLGSLGLGGGNTLPAQRTATQQRFAVEQGKQPVAEQNKALATTGTAIAAIAVVAAVLLLLGVVFSAMRHRRSDDDESTDDESSEDKD